MMVWVAKAYRHQGIGLDAEKALIHHLFTHYFPLIGLISHVALISNMASQQLAIRLGARKTQRPHERWCYSEQKEATITMTLTYPRWLRLYAGARPSEKQSQSLLLRLLAYLGIQRFA